MTAVDRSRVPGLGPDPAFTFPAIEKRRLSNGLEVWTAEHRGAPVVSVLVLVPGGAAADPADRPGLAALTADMLDEGCGGRNAIEVQEALARLGAVVDTEVGADATLVALTTLARKAPPALAILAEMVRSPSFESADFARVRDLRLSRLVQLRDLPPSLADRAFVRRLYGSHPYGHLPLGTHAAIAASSLDEATGLHGRVYHPAAVTIAAVGDATHAELAALVEEAFGSWKTSVSPCAGRALPVREADLPDDSLSARLVILDRPGAAQSELRLGHLGVARATPDYHRLVVLNAILGGQFTSRLNLRLREEKGYTYGARSNFDFRLGVGPFVIQLAVETRVTIDAVREAIAEVAAIRGDRPATVAELDLARAGLTRGYPRSFETAEQIARGLVQLALYDLPADYFTSFPPAILGVDGEQVTHAGVRYLDPSRLAAVIVGDRAALEPALPSLGLGDPVEAVTE